MTKDTLAGIADTETKPRAPKSPRTLETITKAAVKLSLQDRVDLIKAIHAANIAEAATLKANADASQAAAEQAAGLVNGKV